MTEEAQLTAPSETAASLRDAFRELHGRRLHGFALLVTLGDAGHAVRAAGEALAAGAARAVSLRHPERAAAWIRSQALPALRASSRPGGPDEGARRAALAGLGVGDSAFAGLAALDFDDRAALVASLIERFEALDVETILGTDPASTRRSVARARQRYLAAVSRSWSSVRASGQEPAPVGGRGDLAQRVGAIAQRTFGEASPREGSPRSA